MGGKPIANKYCEGKMKRTLKRGSKDLKPLRRKQWKLANVGYALRKQRGMASSKGRNLEPRKRHYLLKAR
jgi:hypothetical protein